MSLKQIEALQVAYEALQYTFTDEELRSFESSDIYERY